MTDSRHNTLVGVGLGLALLLVIGFVVALMDSKAGEVAGALGAVIGGAIGAGGAAAAVYLTLAGMRADDTEIVSAAIMAEVAELCKFPIGQLGACFVIQAGGLDAPKTSLPALMHTPEPVIFPAVANRVSRLSMATLIVSFYSRLHETRGVIEIIVLAPPAPPAVEKLGPKHIQGLADLLISQCQVAKMILESVEQSTIKETELVRARRLHMLRQIDEQLATARLLFPKAESFDGQQTPASHDATPE